MSTHPSRARVWIVPALCISVAAALSTFYLTRLQDIRRTAGMPGAIVAVGCLVAASVMFVRGRRPDSWRTARWLGLAVLGIAAIALAIAVLETRHVKFDGPTPYDAAFLAVAALFLMPAVLEFRTHIIGEDRREVAADIALVGIAIATLLYLLLRPAGAGPALQLSAAEFATIVAFGFAAFGALALWMPTQPHLALFATIMAFATAVLTFADAWLQGVFRPGEPLIDLPLVVGSLFLASIVWVLPRTEVLERKRPARYGRPILTTLSVTAACGALALVAMLEVDGSLDAVQASAMIALLAVAIVLRIVVNQIRGSQAQHEVQDALDQKEVALRETDKALARLQRANETLRESEERLRTVFESAVDGIVELDHKDVVIRANGAFCRMVDLPQSLVEGQPWTALAASIDADETFASLPSTGQGTLRREGHAVYLESRMSEVPGDPPRRLLLVRDVTAARVADQTIRSLFKFLQDRDEDRTQYMRRTNAAIESRQNQIARDLHDGPVQGVSAASLSLEAVLLMLKAGDTDGGIEVLAKVRRELSEEADNLRRLMSGLRPPLLEERGLIPALREMVDKYGRDNDIVATFDGRAMVEIPQDLETLAYRIVQEALSNSSKHARARALDVAVEAVGGQLRVEIVDDGVGFDYGKAREHLQMGRVGLASMRERVELANGTFMVHSTPGKGTTVLATLPLDPVPAAREFSVSEAS
jgi:PAS domain S-box-containing protein